LIQQLKKHISAKDIRFSFTLVLCVFLCACEKPSTYEKIAKHKTLHVITRNAPAIYYEGREGPMGFEYDLAKLFADELGLKLELKIATTRTQILSALDNEYTNIAAAGMIASLDRANRYKYSLPYMQATPVVVYRYGSKRPRSIKDIIGKHIAVVSDSYHTDELNTLKLKTPE
jgi:membrane-bound lytic murein transglycosylase F